MGHLVDIDPSDNPQAWVEYEIPISLMVNNHIKSSLIHCHAEDNFNMKGVAFHVEKQNSDFDPEKDLDKQLIQLVAREKYIFFQNVLAFNNL